MYVCKLYTGKKFIMSILNAAQMERIEMCPSSNNDIAMALKFFTGRRWFEEPAAFR
jgi:hypothetical protein